MTHAAAGGPSLRAVHAWLMLLPALALLALFTHWPTLATFIDSFYSTPKGARPAVWVGLDNYRGMVADPVFWKAVRNNLVFASATIPLSIALALVMALWVNERIAGRAFLRMAYFTPTVLPMIAVANIWLFSTRRSTGCSSRSPARSGCRRTTGSAIRRPRSAPSRWWRSGRKPASS